MMESSPAHGGSEADATLTDTLLNGSRYLSSLEDALEIYVGFATEMFDLFHVAEVFEHDFRERR